MKRERKTAKKHGKKQGKILDNKTRKQSKKVFEKLNCAPDTNRKHKFSCFNTNKLMLIRNAWNARHPDCKITIDAHAKAFGPIATFSSDQDHSICSPCSIKSSRTSTF